MEQWSILSNTLNYIHYDRNQKNFQNLDIIASNICKNHLHVRKGKDTIEVDFGLTFDALREEYLDIYQGIQSEIVNMTGYDENSDLSTTYLAKSDRSKNVIPRQKTLFLYKCKGTC